MEITCSNCNAKLNVPDEKIPKDQSVFLNCPKCKNRIMLDARKISMEELFLEDAAAETGELDLKAISEKQTKPAVESYDYDDYSGDQALDFLEEGTKVGLIIMKSDEKREKVGVALEWLGHKCVYSDNTRDALGKLRFHTFNVVVLADGFDNQDISYSPVMNYLNRLPMSSRRKIFVVLIGDRFKTMDDMMAFALSANSVVNAKDLDKLTLILKKGLAESEKFYKVLLDTLAEVGKD
jgi:predicted Zn finger-like uncharacterized protein